MLSMLILAFSSNDTVVVIISSLIIFVNLSNVTTIVSLLFDLGDSPIMLMLIYCHGS